MALTKAEKEFKKHLKNIDAKKDVKMHIKIGIPLVLLATAILGILILAGVPISPWWLLAPVLSPVALVAAIVALIIITALIGLAAIIFIALAIIALVIVCAIPLLLLILSIGLLSLF